MRKIKSYTDFSPINESLGFGSSNEYYDLMRLFSKKEREEFKEYFYELTDDNIVDLRIWSFIGDESGRSIGYSQSDVDLTHSHSVYYTIELKSKDGTADLSSLSIDNKTENLRKISNNLTKIVNVTESFEKNIGSENLQSKDIYGGSNITIKYTIRGEDISKATMETFYKKWRENYGPKYDEGIRFLIGEYQHNGIQNPSLDTNDDDPETVLIGFFLEDEIIVVADYNKTTDKFNFDRREFQRSVSEYRTEQRLNADGL